jgi:hypothetical protein
MAIGVPAAAVGRATNDDRDMEPTKELIDELSWERVKAAGRMSPADKLLAGVDLFEFTSTIMAAGIREQFPGANEARV